MWHYLWLIPVGLVIGALGTLIGAGGGFILVPILLLVYPHEEPEVIASISLAVVFFNALSGSISYGRMGRIDYRSSLLFASATMPGAILGALCTTYIPRRGFDLLLGACLMGLSAYLLRGPGKSPLEQTEHPSAGKMHRVVAEKDGTVHRYSFSPGKGLGLSLIVGWLSSLLGIGGGIIHVPALVRWLNFPVHIATATSHLILAIMALTGTLVHVFTGAFHHGWRRMVMLAIGVIIGAPFGAKGSNRLRGDWIIRTLAIALAFVAIRLIWVSIE